MGRVIGTALALAVALGCTRASEPASPPARPAFYYWRTTFRLSPIEQRALAALHVARIYLRVFDVEWNEADGAPRAIGKLALGDGAALPASTEIVPVVFVREQVLRRLPADRIPAFARSLWADVDQRARAIGFAPRELQLDCDWTDGTRGAFFALVDQLRAATRPAGLALSATIRLHQIKYRERTGVPPVDRGMLMFYNMGTFGPDARTRAIFDPDSAASYLGRLGEYPLPLDVALPIWSWTVHVRDDRVIDLLQSTDPGELPALDFLRPLDPGRYVATRTAFLHGTLLREGDLLKVEVTGPADTMTAAELVAPRLAATPTARTIALFDLSERNLTRHGIDKLEQVFTAIR